MAEWSEWSDFWSDGAEDPFFSLTAETYTDEPLTDEMVAAELELGYRLPGAYLRALRVRNGGFLRRACCPVPDPRPGEADVVRLRTFFGVGWSRDFSLCGPLGQCWWITELGFPDIGVYVAVTSEGVLALDYRACGPQGEPSVAHVVQTEDGHRVTGLAPDFTAFAAQLFPEDEVEAEVSEPGGGERDDLDADPEDEDGADLEALLRTLAELYAQRPSLYDSAEAAELYAQRVAGLLHDPHFRHRLWWLIGDHAAFFPPELVAQCVEASWAHHLFPPEEAWAQLNALPLPAAQSLIRRIEDLDLLGARDRPEWDHLFAPLLGAWFSTEETARRALPVSVQNEVWLAAWRAGQPLGRVPEGQAALLVGRLWGEAPGHPDHNLRVLQALHQLLVSHPLPWPARALALERLIGGLFVPSYGYDRLVVRLRELGLLPDTVLGGLRRLNLAQPEATLPFDVLGDLPELNRGDPWADELLGALGSLTPQSRVPWTRLLRHAATVTALPDPQWLDHGAALLTAVGLDEARAALLRAWARLGEPRPTPWLDVETQPPP